MNTSTKNLEQLINEPYKYGFSTNIKIETIEKGLNEEIIHLISSKKEEPSFMLEFRLDIFIIKSICCIWTDSYLNKDDF